ncbi:MAG: TonB-dependent receptor, partial [Syntrophothermus sp.]
MFSQEGTVTGRVFNRINNEPVPFVNIILENNPKTGTTSDIDGNFTIKSVDPGYIRLVASAVGFKKKITEDFLVTRSHPVFVDIAMDEEVITLKDVEIKSGSVVRKIANPVSMQTLSVQEIEKDPGSNRDVSRVIQVLPGVASSVAFRNDIIVRGGGPGENRFYLDGVEIPYINHFATQGASGGPVGIINVDLIREIDLFSGAFQASRGNALSSVMELRQVEGSKDRFNGRFSIGSNDIALTLDAPVSRKSSLLLSVRRSYLQFLFDVLGLPFLPTYNDYQLKYRIDLDQKNQLSIISIGALDQFRLNTGIKNPDDFQKYVVNTLPVNNQWSYAFGIVYRHFRHNGSDTYVLSRNMLDNRRYKYNGNIEADTNLLLDYKSRETENKFRYEGTLNLNDWKISFGGGAEYSGYSNDTYQKLFIADSVRVLDYNSKIDLFKYSLFAQVSKPFFKEKLTLTLGARLDGNTYSDEMNNPLRQFSPRFTASYRLAEKWYLNFNTGRYFQLPPYTALGFRDNNGRLVNDSLGIKYISADHVVLGLEFLPRQSTKISVEGFYKYYMDYPLSVADGISLASKGADYTVLGDEPVVPISKGRAYGFELLARDVNLFRFNVLLSYTFVRSEFTNRESKYIPSSWDNRHLLNFVISRKFKYNWQAGIKFRFAGGAPYTPYDLGKSSLVSAWDVQSRGYLDYSSYNSLRLGSFNQLDIRIDKGFYFQKWSLMVYLDVQNVLNFQAQQPAILINTQPDGSVIRYTDPQGNERYQLRTID